MFNNYLTGMTQLPMYCKVPLYWMVIFGGGGESEPTVGHFSVWTGKRCRSLANHCCIKTRATNNQTIKRNGILANIVFIHSLSIPHRVRLYWYIVNQWTAPRL